MEFDTKYMNSNVNDYDGEQEFDYEHNGHESANKEMDDQKHQQRNMEARRKGKKQRNTI